MAKEIERKFLVNPKWKKMIDHPVTTVIGITQGYIFGDSGKTLRVRRSLDKNSGIETFYQTLKGPTKGIAKPEFEYQIPRSDAMYMLKNLCIGDLVTKDRYVINIPGTDLKWEVDVFSKENKGLVVAEIELKSAKQKFDIPDWLGTEVTKEKKYSNYNLSKSPFSGW